MKRIFTIFCLASVVAGLTFYWVQSRPSKLKAADTFATDNKTVVTQVSEIKPASQTSSPSTAAPKPTTTSKKGCGCCRDSLAKVKQRRKALEMWAREMIATLGYEEGMKRVNAKSPTLARRVKRLLEEEKRVPTSTGAHTAP